jgi:hypothetical protein
MHRSVRRGAAAGVSRLAVATLFAFGAAAAEAASIRIINRDGGTEGLNDTTPVAPIGGNRGTTLGEQRLIAFEHAANIWASLIDSPVDIEVVVGFDPLPCDRDRAVLGQASPNSVHSDFDGAPRSGTFYPAALANRLAGADLCAPGRCRGSADIAADFNGSFGTTCDFPAAWYNGLDRAGTRRDADLVTIALHEIGHGLGFVSLVDADSGRAFMGSADSYSIHVEDHATGFNFSEMTDTERRAALVSGDRLHWVGPEVTGAAARLSSGVDGGDHVRLYAPIEVEIGSSLSHWDEILRPDELMEPSFSSSLHEVGLAAEAFRDLGWVLAGAGDCSGDCNGDGLVGTSELVLAARIALRERDVESCSEADGDGNGAVTVGELVVAVRKALGGCFGEANVIVETAAQISGLPSPPPGCSGDCDGDLTVDIGELIRGVNIALEEAPLANCPGFDVNDDGVVSVSELILAVGNALDGCPCPHDFLTPPVAGGLACIYQGRWSDECGDDGLQATFSGDGVFVIVGVIVDDPGDPLLFIGQASSTQRAELRGVGDQGLSGSIVLGEAGRSLSVLPDMAPDLFINDCQLHFYEGRLTALVDTGATGEEPIAAVRRLRAEASEQ